MNTPPPCPSDIPAFLHTRPGKSKMEYDVWRAEYVKIPQELRDKYNAWQHECSLAEQGTVDRALWGYKMMQAMEPEKYPLGFHELPDNEQRAMKEAVLRIAASLFTHGVSRDVVVSGSPLPQSFCFFVAGRAWG